MNNHCEKVKLAMLAVQRYSWEQGVCAQALYELGDSSTAFAMAYDAVLRQQADGRLAVITANTAVTDPASNGEVVWMAYQHTGNAFFKTAAEKMLDYLLYKAPRADDGLLFHTEVSYQEGFSPNQFWSDSVYMAPPFLACMGKLDEAAAQIRGYLHYLQDDSTKLMFHMYDAGQQRFVRKKRWATGNGWTLLGISRVLWHAEEKGRTDIAEYMRTIGTEILDAMLKYQLPDGRFHDILDDENSFVDGTSAMMLSAFIFRGCAQKWLSEEYIPSAEKVCAAMEQYIDELGIIHGVCGCPDFVTEGTSAEAMAAYLMMHAWREKAI